MREVIPLNDNWILDIDGEQSSVTLPHTWNSLDGQDGTNGYRRTRAVYTRLLPDITGRTYLDIQGANSCCTVYADSSALCVHKGGYSAFRVRIPQGTRELSVEVDNSDFEEVYPSAADFTFYGGLYRNVSLIKVGDCHFSFSDYSSDGIYVTPEKCGDTWSLKVKAFVDNPLPGYKVRYRLLDMNGNVTAQTERDTDKPSAKIEGLTPILWQGRENPYLYTLECEIYGDGEICDNVEIPVGFREYYIDALKGFFLNGKHLKLQGVARHQDRENMGNAITEREHTEDIMLMLEMGVNSVRLAHYQQNRYFYELCDRKGLLVWAEIPVISRFSPKKQANAKTQLAELIKQNYNHPSIFCWGIENEITIAGRAGKKLEQAMQELEREAKSIDSTRYTACAQLAMLSVDSPLNSITDILGYNHYFGWYFERPDAIDSWLDSFFAKCGQARLCLSEYGAEGIIKYHSEKPVQGDYSEDYQAVFHEHYIRAINSHERLWGSYCWNMFDFGSALRNEGGVRGRNNKGLVSFDRKIKKDAFYLYKAFWSDEKFLHITKKRFVNRVAGATEIKIYSNLTEITLTGEGYEKTLTADRVFTFENVPVKQGNNVYTASCGDYTDEITINGVTQDTDEYTFSAGSSYVRNWFDTDTNGESLSVNDRLTDILANEEIKRMAAGASDKAEKLLASPLMKLVPPVRLRTVLPLARLMGMDAGITDMADRFLSTIKK